MGGAPPEWLLVFGCFLGGSWKDIAKNMQKRGDDDFFLTKSGEEMGGKEGDMNDYHYGLVYDLEKTGSVFFLSPQAVQQHPCGSNYLVYPN